ncbi:NAD(P)H-binding protein [Leifsonia lichenia]
MRAVILGGTGAIGGATAERLARTGWTVDVTGRDATAMPDELSRAGVRFHSLERDRVSGIERLIGDDTDLLVDLVAYSARDARALLPAMGSVGQTVVISTRAVYVDADGRHINGDEPPRFPVPLREDNPTLPPAGDDVDPHTREGYAPCKVAVELTVLGSGLPVTVIRPSKVHGRWARNARTHGFVDAMLRGDERIELAGRGQTVDHLTAAANTAALIETVARTADPADGAGPRILNSADPDTPTAEEIVRAIGERVGWAGRIELLGPGEGGGAVEAGREGDGDPTRDPDRGRHPWLVAHPIVLDTTASTAIGYAPVGAGLELLMDEVDWVRRHG